MCFKTDAVDESNNVRAHMSARIPNFQHAILEDHTKSLKEFQEVLQSRTGPNNFQKTNLGKFLETS